MRDEVVWLYREASARGLIVGSSGNVSARVPGGMVITPSGGDPLTASAGDLAGVTLDGAALDAAVPSSEWAMHAAIYRVRPEAGFIVHSHSDACTALACLGSGLPAFHYMVLQFGASAVPCVPYVTFGTMELAALAGEAMRDCSACLLGNHGTIVSGVSAKQALDRSVLLETLCRQYLMALAAGTPRLLTDSEMDAAKERFKSYGSRQPAV